ncbi:GATA-type transcription factor SCDLUD_003409 [Saccharomycodes ludwigii]|uniref:GATA-type transcription factor n=1 Tax=Saccharomycodes ludwigii TaxID=36035 RepID=UPI001E8B1E4E|nr:hypothetical protein SCDLUD_003409 [Saccharomycodes ludwigii]KAH3900429.1 hypothetical protein SCDLUD_003409 [Saccharomycodes ludwigii]
MFSTPKSAVFKTFISSSPTFNSNNNGKDKNSNDAVTTNTTSNETNALTTVDAHDLTNGKIMASTQSNKGQTNNVTRLPSITELFSSSISNRHTVDPQISPLSPTSVRFRTPNYSLDNTNPQRYVTFNTYSSVCDDDDYQKNNHNNSKSSNFLHFNRSPQPTSNISTHYNPTKPTITTTTTTTTSSSNNSNNSSPQKRNSLDKLCTAIQAVEQGEPCSKDNITITNTRNNSVNYSRSYSIDNLMDISDKSFMEDKSDYSKCKETLSNLNNFVVQLQNYNKKWDTILSSDSNNNNSDNDNFNKYLNIQDIHHALELNAAYRANLQVLMNIKKKNLKVYPDSDLNMASSLTSSSLSSSSSSSSSNTTSVTNSFSATQQLQPPQQLNLPLNLQPLPLPQLSNKDEKPILNGAGSFIYPLANRNSIANVATLTENKNNNNTNTNNDGISGGGTARSTFINAPTHRKTISDPSSMNYHHNNINTKRSLVNNHYGTHMVTLSNILAIPANSEELPHSFGTTNTTATSNNIIRGKKRSHIKSKSMTMPKSTYNSSIPTKRNNSIIPSYSNIGIKKTKSADGKKANDPSKTNNSSDMKCLHCGQNDTPEWRRGPYGNRSLCNACGLFYGKLIRKFGFNDSNLLMHYRRSKNADDRRVPKAVEVPEKFIAEYNRNLE